MIFMILITFGIANILIFGMSILVYTKTDKINNCTEDNCQSSDCIIRQCINGECVVKYTIENCCTDFESCYDCTSVNELNNNSTYFLVNKIETNTIQKTSCELNTYFQNVFLTNQSNLVASCFLYNNDSQYDDCNSTFNEITITENMYANIISFYDELQEYINLNGFLIPQNTSLPSLFNDTLASLLISNNINITEILYTNYITPCQTNDVIRLLNAIIIYGNGNLSVNNMIIDKLNNLENITNINIRNDLLVNGILLQNSSIQGFTNNTETNTTSYNNILFNNNGGNVGMGQLNANESLSNPLTVSGNLATEVMLFKDDNFNQNRNTSNCASNITNCGLDFSSYYSSELSFSGFNSSNSNISFSIYRKGRTVTMRLDGATANVSFPVVLVASFINNVTTNDFPLDVYFGNDTRTSAQSVYFPFNFILPDSQNVAYGIGIITQVYSVQLRLDGYYSSQGPSVQTVTWKPLYVQWIIT
jgi:hypothetical protein